MIRKGVTLIELIFTVVIIATVFTVVPKIIFAINKSDSLSMRQDALMNGVSMLHMVSNMPWDKNNIDSKDILHTDIASDKFECDEMTFYRVGGFIGSRRCEDNLSASVINITLHNGDDIYTLNNIGDFNNTDVNITAYGSQLYDINISVNYIDDSNFNYVLQSVAVDLNSSKNSPISTNLKNITMKVFYHGKRAKRRELAIFRYTSTNIGLVEINKREWR